MSDLQELKSKSIDTKTFLRLQEIVTQTRKFTDELQDLRQSIKVEFLSFKPSQSVQDFMSASCTFGSINGSASKLETDIVVPEIAFPVSSFNHAAARPKAGQISGPQKLVGEATDIIATMWDTFSIQLKDVTGIAIAKKGKKVITDKRNVNLFSHDMTFLHRVSVPGRLWDSCDQ